MEAAFSGQHSAVSQDQNQNQNQDQQQEQRQNLLTPEQQAHTLAVKLARTYEELTRLLERNPAMKREITQGTSKEDKVYQKLKQRLNMADMAPRCRWVKQDGTSCRSPQMKQHIYCFAHMQMAEARTLLLLLPPPEDANAIQVGLMRIQKAMIEDTISTKKAGLLLYSMQLALTNVGQTTFGKAKDEEMVRDTVDEEIAISEEARSNQHSAFSERQNQHQRPFTAKDAEDAEENQGLRENQNLFTAKNAEDAKENQGLPLMNTDDADRNGLPRMEAHDRGLESGFRPLEWKPTPDMYRMDTKEGREAYEANFGTKIDGTKIKPGSSGEQRPTQAVIPRKERSETYNSSLRDERPNSLRSPMPKGMGLGPRSASGPLDADTGAGSVLRPEMCCTPKMRQR
ncbi:MAG TPA: hypothetical protein VGK01_09215 [Candidatus Angelobacter sp.]